MAGVMMTILAIIIITSGQSNLTQGRIAAVHGLLNNIRQVAPMCTELQKHPL